MSGGSWKGAGTYGEGKPAVLEGCVCLEDEHRGPAACEVGEGPAGGADHADDGHGEERQDAEGVRGGGRAYAWLSDGGNDALFVCWDANGTLAGGSLGW